MLNWEIPWNPNRLEQRNGRVDRHGQRAPEVMRRDGFDALVGNPLIGGQRLTGAIGKDVRE